MAGIIAFLFFVTTFLAAAIAVLIAAFVQSRLRSRQEALAGTKPLAALDGSDDDGLSLLREPRHSSISMMHLLLERLNVVDHIKRRLDDAGSNWSAGRVATTMLLLGAVLAALALKTSWLPAGASLVAFAIGASLPWFYLGRLRERRMAQFESQFPDALESLARAMRAGQPLQTAIESLAGEMAAPLGPEFRKIRDERRLGMPWNVALAKFSDRVPILEVRLFVAAALMNARSGGRFTEVLENLAETVREGASLRGEIRAISAHGRLTGTVLSILPFGIATMLYLTSPDYLGTLIHHPLGPYLITAALVCVITGHFVMQRIVKIRI